MTLCAQPGHHPRDRVSGNRRRLAVVLVLVAGYMVAEIIGGLLANSLALLADAGHMFSDAAALGLSLFAAWIAGRPATPQRSYGYYRTEILAALANGAALVAVAVLICAEAWRRLQEPPSVQGGLMMAVAVGGLGVNLLSLGLLAKGREESLNVRGAWLHVLSDALGSIGAIVAGVLIWAFGWNWADPVTSVLIGALIVYSSWRLLSESVAVLMEGAPPGIDVDAVRAAMAATPGVREIHDLHIWTITSGMDSLSAHVIAEDGRPHAALLTDLRTLLDARFGIHHVTLQIEPASAELDCDWHA